MDAAHIELFETHPDLMPGTMFFHCDRLSATLQPDDCATRYRQARVGSPCARCPIGAQHTTQPGNTTQLRWMTLDCLRCGRPTSRMVPGRVCVSCYNREGEFRTGRNARGKPPAEFRPLRTRRVGVQIKDKPAWRLVAETQTELKPAAVELRQHGGTIHGEQPGELVWLPRSEHFAYRRHDGAILAADEGEDGTLTYRPVRAGEKPAKATMPTLMAIAGFLAAWLSLPVEDAEVLSEQWRSMPRGCSDCASAVLQAGRVECQCPICEAHA